MTKVTRSELLKCVKITGKVSECFENELEAITFDLSKAEDMKTLLSGIDILP